MPNSALNSASMPVDANPFVVADAHAVCAEADAGERRFIGSSAVFLREVAKLRVVAGCDAGVLVQGETGTGKEVFARAIHYLSARAGKPWVAVNCGAIPAELVENELFGHTKGAYTTASHSQIGLVGEAEGGTLFLDDVDCLPLAAQSKLLRFLQEREYRAVGSHVIRHADVRVIAATNRHLCDMATRGHFRSDLYFRLNVLNLKLPPLRERREDIAPLARHFIDHFAQRFKRGLRSIDAAALQMLQRHDWPGNVRELQHTIERAVVLARADELSSDDIDIDGVDRVAPVGESFGAAKARVIEQFERGYLEQLLSLNAGNVTRAARAAQKNRRAFFALMQKHGIAPERFRAAS